MQGLLSKGKRILLEAVPLQHLAPTTNRMISTCSYRDSELKVSCDLKIVGLISHSHIPTRASVIPEKVFEIFTGSCLILHVGDLIRLSVLKDLERLTPVVAVCGNMDGPDVRETRPKMDAVKVACMPTLGCNFTTRR